MADTANNALSPRVKDLTGRVFGLLTVLRFHSILPNRAALWVCKCDCGKEHLAEGRTLMRKHVYSCGCYDRETSRKRLTTHGLSKTAEYGIWRGVKKRIEEPTYQSYARYGGKGLTLSKSWSESFERFYADVGPRPTNRHTLDRIDNTKGYSKENCRWATYKEQARNRCSNHHLTFQGETHTISGWGEKLTISHGVISMRLRAGWSLEMALTTPLRAHKKAPRHFGREAEDYVTA